jgi:hypothetical protein
MVKSYVVNFICIYTIRTTYTEFLMNHTRRSCVCQWITLIHLVGPLLPYTRPNSQQQHVFFRFITSKVFGGTLWFAVLGGDPIGEQLHLFLRAYFCCLFSRSCFCCLVIQGYALTEDTRCGIVGPTVLGVEMSMLQSEPDIKDSAGLSYLHTDTVGSKGEPAIGRRETCMRGPCVAFGY